MIKIIEVRQCKDCSHCSLRDPSGVSYRYPYTCYYYYQIARDAGKYELANSSKRHMETNEKFPKWCPLPSTETFFRNWGVGRKNRVKRCRCTISKVCKKHGAMI